MDFSLSDEQRLLKDSVDNFIQREYDFERRKKAMAQPQGWSRETWGKLAEQGLLAIPFSEDHGGIGGTPVELMIVMEAFGRGLVVEPYFTTVVVAGVLIREGGTEAQKAEYLPKIAAGELLAAFAGHERRARYSLTHVETSARREGDQYILDGQKDVVPHGDTADLFIVSARTSGDIADPTGVSLFLVPKDTPGLTVTPYQNNDGTRGAQLVLDDVGVPAAQLLGSEGAGAAALDRMSAVAIAALCAEAVGCMARANELTLDYLKTREQFGVKIGTFQVLQHRMVEMLQEVEMSRSITLLAVMQAESDDEAERRRAASAAKAQIGRSGKFVGQWAIQLHGGIGMTQEYAVGHYFKRLTLIDRTFGDAGYHLKKFAEIAHAA